MGGAGSGVARDPERAAPDGRRRAGREPGARGAGRGVRARLEGVRARADARPQRQRGRRLLDRERRPDGRAHRRLGHGRAGDDAHRPRVPGHARRRHRGAARGRGGHRRLQHPVRRPPGHRPDGRHRDEPAGVPLVRAGVQGDRLPDREDRGQAGHRLHARRDPQRHHRRDPGLVRADARLRRGQDAAVRVREVPDRGPGADHAHEERGRGDGDRPQLHRGAGQGDALDRDQPGRLVDRRRPRRRSGRPGPAGGRAGDVPVDGRLYTIEQALRAGATVAEVAGASGIDPWFVEQIATAQQVGGDIAGRAGARPRSCCAGPSGSGCPTGRSPRCGRSWPARTGSARCGCAAGSGRCSRPWTPARPSSPRPRRTTTRPTTRRPRSRRSRSGPRCSSSAPGRTGSARASSSTTRACTRPRRCATAGYETVMVNCNPETVSTDYDTSDRLYFEPLTLEDVLEVVHAEQESGTVAGVICTLGGQTPLGLAQRLKDAGVPILGTQPEAIHLAEDREEFSAVLTGAGLPAPAARDGVLLRRGQGRGRGDRLPGPGPALVRARRAGHGDRVRRGRAGVVPDPAPGRDRRVGPDRAPDPGRPVPRRRGRAGRGRALRRRASSTSAA